MEASERLASHFMVCATNRLCPCPTPGSSDGPVGLPFRPNRVRGCGRLPNRKYGSVMGHATMEPTLGKAA